MRQLLLCCTFLLTLSVFAQTKKALIIGIDIYKPAGAVGIATQRSVWTNLDGCVNDANAITDLVMARYDFPVQGIVRLVNQEATRERIIQELKRLVSESKKGDVVFIFYAGHGSQVYNSLSREADKKDESMVPADSYKGVPDIRDKELAGFFNQLLDKEVNLTVIFDSCHSGSIGRGNPVQPPKVRYIPESAVDAKDASAPVKPESRGALIISAAQDFELAKEQRDENNIAHGAFTLALLRALQQLPVDASANTIYSGITSIMKYYGKTQEPVLAGTEERKNNTLFGLPKGSVRDQLAVGITKIDSKGIELQGGLTFGFNEGMKLASLNTNDTLEIVSMRGANKSIAKSINGLQSNLKPGMLFKVINWSSGKGARLKIFIPAGVQDAELRLLTKNIKSVLAAPGIRVAKDLSYGSKALVLSYISGTWGYYDAVANGRKNLGSLDIKMLNNKMEGEEFFINLPPGLALEKDLKETINSFGNIEIVSDPVESQYSLVGRVNEAGIPEYAFIKTMVAHQDSTESMPLRTDFIQYSFAAASPSVKMLSENIFKLARIRDWLMLSSPPAGANKFPFRLSFYHYNSQTPLETDLVKVNDTLSLYFEMDPKMGDWNGRKRYLYVFNIDSRGAMSLIFPDIETGNIENRFPLSLRDERLEQKTHLADLLITPPSGADHYFILSSEEAIANLSAFEQEGVRTRGPSKTANPLEMMLYPRNKSRNMVITPANWSIHKTILRASEK
jgi:hypothetical protein